MTIQQLGYELHERAIQLRNKQEHIQRLSKGTFHTQNSLLEKLLTQKTKLKNQTSLENQRLEKEVKGIETVYPYRYCIIFIYVSMTKDKTIMYEQESTHLKRYVR